MEKTLEHFNSTRNLEIPEDEHHIQQDKWSSNLSHTEIWDEAMKTKDDWINSEYDEEKFKEILIVAQKKLLRVTKQKERHPILSTIFGAIESACLHYKYNLGMYSCALI